jgi:uncharacterized protein YjbI with pentapeptide repeats
VLRLRLSEAREWVGLDASRANLSYLDLHGYRLAGANLSRSDLTGTDLRNADLSKANLSKSV